MEATKLVNLANKGIDTMQVNIFDAKTDLSKLIKKLETKEETSITIARHGKPVAVLIPFTQAEKKTRIGIAKNKASFPDNVNIDIDNEIIESMFYMEVK